MRSFAAGLSHAAHTSAGLEEAVALLSEAWGTEPPTPLSMRVGSSMTMVELPPALEITDTPGVPGAGVRGQLRERYKIEAAVANFGPKGNFVRLSNALYNTREDYERLRDAVDELIVEQQS